MMDYRYIKAFLETAKTLSFSQAAKNLHVAQSAISRQIKLLEESLECDLIVRSPKQILLTQKGEELFALARQFDEMAQNLFEKEIQRTLRIGSLQGLLENWLSPYLVRYQKRYPQSLKIHVDNPDKMKLLLSQGQLDVIFTTENIQTDLISSLRLFNENLVLASKTPIDGDRIDQYPWIVFDDRDYLFQISKKRSEHIINVNSISTIVNFVKNGIGVGVLPSYIIKKTDRIYTYELGQLPTSEIYMSMLNYKSIPRYIQDFTDQISKLNLTPQ